MRIVIILYCLLGLSGPIILTSFTAAGPIDMNGYNITDRENLTGMDVRADNIYVNGLVQYYYNGSYYPDGGDYVQVYRLDEQCDGVDDWVVAQWSNSTIIDIIAASIDNHNIIQLAINSTASKGGNVVFGPGEYSGTGDIIISDMANIIGAGSNRSQVPGNVKGTFFTWSNCKNAFLWAGTSGITTQIKDIGIHLSGSGNPSAIAGRFNDRSIIREVSIRNSPGHGINMMQDSGVYLIENVIIQNVGEDYDAIRLFHNSDAVVRYADVVGGTSGNGVSIQGGGHLRISEINAYMGRIGIYVGNGAIDVDLFKCRGNDNSLDGIRISSSKDVSIVGGSAYGNGNYGLNVADGAEGTSVLGFKANSNTWAGFLLAGQNTSVTDCGTRNDNPTLHQNYGFFIDTTARRNTLTSNYVYDLNDNYDVYIESSSSGTTIIGGGIGSKGIYGTEYATIENVDGWATKASGISTGTGKIAYWATGLATNATQVNISPIGAHDYAPYIVSWNTTHVAFNASNGNIVMISAKA